MSRVIEEQLALVKKADLTKFNCDTNSFLIPKRNDIKLELDHYYIIHLKDSFKTNNITTDNWNKGNKPLYDYFKVEVSQLLGRMIKINGLAFNPETKQDYDYSWSGWLNEDDIEILSKLS